MEYTISYKKIRHGYVRLSPNGKLSITIPHSLKNDENFKKSLIEKGEKLLSRNKKRIQIQSHTSDSIILFGEEVSIAQFPIPNKPIPYLKSTLHEYIQPIADKYSDLIGKNYKEIKIRKLKSKRGSCSYDNVLTFNLDLIHLQTKYIKYVIIHEVCHIRVKNHSSKFRDLVGQYCPDYKKLRKELRNFIIR
ncbi:M48 family metallopeptidase [Candidatus Gracilibacteria bacterium]|nr:M48 family metallopeptidase [Candidatus Gracilibacteria bacterium]